MAAVSPCATRHPASRRRAGDRLISCIQFARRIQPCAESCGLSRDRAALNTIITSIVTVLLAGIATDAGS